MAPARQEYIDRGKIDSSMLPCTLLCIACTVESTSGTVQKPIGRATEFPSSLSGTVISCAEPDTGTYGLPVTTEKLLGLK